MALETVVIKIKGDSKDLNKTIDQLEKVGKVDRQNAASFKKTSKAMGSGFDGLKKKAMALGATMLGAFAIQQVIGSAINTLKNFEKELSTLQSITGSTAKEMEFFQQAAKDVGQATKTSATEVVKAFTLIGSAQPELLKNSKALAEVTKQALILGKAAGIDAASAATALTSAMNQFGASASDAAKFTDIFATSQQKGSSFIEATSEALINAGAAASAAGLSFETTNAAIQALAKGAIVGARAGTALTGVLSKLSSQADDSINPSMIGLGDTITELAKRNLTLKDATKLVGQEGATGLLTLIKQKDIYFELDGALNETGNALEQMAINTDNLDGSLDELGNAWEIFILSLSGSDGIMKDTIDFITTFITTITKGFKTVDEIKAEVYLKNLAENAREDVKEFEIYAKALKATGTEIKTLAELSESFLENDKKRLKILKDETKYVKDLADASKMGEIKLIENRIEAVTGFIAVQKEQAESTENLSELEKLGAKTVGALLKEKTDLIEAQKKLNIGSKELAENKARVTQIIKILKGETKEAKTEFQLLQGVVSELKKTLLDQALAGDLDTKTLIALNEATEKVTKAQEKLNDAMKTDEDIAKIAAAEATLMNQRGKATSEMTSDIDAAFKLAQDIGGDQVSLMAEFMTSDFETFKEFEEKKREVVQKTADERLEKIQNIVALISEVEQQASAIFAQISENKLIAIDNEETKALRALENQGLGEEKLAEKQKQIHEKSDKERAEIMRKQAIADKASAIVQATMRTALAIVSALAMLPPNIPLSVLVGVLGAAQVAVIAAQPIPEFHEGKKAELKDGEMYAKILKSESVIPPEQSKKYKGAIDSMIDKKFENYVFQEYMLPMMKSMSKKDPTPYDDVHVWNNQKKQIKLMQENNGLTKLMINTLVNTNHRRTWRG